MHEFSLDILEAVFDNLPGNALPALTAVSCQFCSIFKENYDFVWRQWKRAIRCEFLIHTGSQKIRNFSIYSIYFEKMESTRDLYFKLLSKHFCLNWIRILSFPLIKLVNSFIN